MRRTGRLAARAAVVLLILAVMTAAVAYWRARQTREALFAALSPVKIVNCELARFGHPNDGGYLLCGNLLDHIVSAYSYGIDGRDEWGCDIAAAHRVPVHQYDCINTRAPSCPAAADLRFHAECIGPERAAVDGRPFDTFAGHVEKNGEVGKRVVMKVDVEGAEWRALAAAPEHVLNAIDQLAVEFHNVEGPQYLDTIRRLNEFFYVAHVHQNNFECRPGFDPFPGPIFEVLFVNQRIAVADPWVDARVPSPLDAPNNPALPDCQAPPARSEPARIGGWLYRYWERLLVRSGLS